MMVAVVLVRKTTTITSSMDAADSSPFVLETHPHPPQTLHPLTHTILSLSFSS
jgi:hypothetical protein